MQAPLPANEPERLRALDRYEILDTPVEQDFDAVTRLAASICDTPISVVNFIAEGRQWFKSEVGLGVRETPLEASFCAHAILQHELFVVPDATLEPRFADNPLVAGDPGLRFYAGALLESSEGLPLGTLCVLDTRPRELEERQLDALRVLSRHVMSMIELRRSEREQRVTADRLARALGARQRLMATVAHDLRSPLAVVLLGAKLMEGGTLTLPEQKTTALRLERAASHMKNLVDDLLDLESSDTQSLSLDRASLALAPLLHDVVDLLGPIAEEAGVVLEVGESTDAVVHADEQRLYQVMTNLIGNALKFTPEDGVVTVTLTVADEVATVMVADTGVGIGPEDLASVFDPFVRVRSMNTRGAGLGLAISKRIIEAHGGRMDLTSVLGTGSAFSFSLPIPVAP